MVRDTYVRIMLLATAIMMATVVFLRFGDLLGLGGDVSSRLITAITVIAVLIYGSSMVILVRRNPSPLAISLLGFPDSGKTVFLTVLFDSLMSAGEPEVAFWPYGTETVERIGADLGALMRGEWLPRTAPGQVFFYRANSRVGTGLVARRHKIEIGDYAGEHIHEFDTDHERWLHKTDYYKYVLQSNIVLLSVDCDTVLGATRAEIREMENSFIAALHLLIENKGVPVGRKFGAPVALIFMKADLATSIDEPTHHECRVDVDELCSRVARLVQFCERRCSNFRVFAASSVGDVGKDGLPPPTLRPWGVIEPVVWALRHA